MKHPNRIFINNIIKDLYWIGNRIKPNYNIYVIFSYQDIFKYFGLNCPFYIGLRIRMPKRLFGEQNFVCHLLLYTARKCGFVLNFMINVI